MSGMFFYEHAFFVTFLRGICGIIYLYINTHMPEQAKPRGRML